MNEEEYLEKLLESIEKQGFDDYEVVVADSRSDDGTVEVAEDHGAEVVTGERRGPGHARNLGAEEADGDILVFLDADVILGDRDFLGKVADAFRGSGKGVGAARWKAYDTGWFGKLVFWLGSFTERVVNLTGFTTAAAGYVMIARRDVFEEVDGFDEEMPWHETHDFVDRAASAGGGFQYVDSTLLVSARRLNQKGLSGILADYLPSLPAYLLGNKEKVKENYRFETIDAE